MLFSHENSVLEFSRLNVDVDLNPIGMNCEPGLITQPPLLFLLCSTSLLPPPSLLLSFCLSISVKGGPLHNCIEVIEVLSAQRLYSNLCAIFQEPGLTQTHHTYHLLCLCLCVHVIVCVCVSSHLNTDPIQIKTFGTIILKLFDIKKVHDCEGMARHVIE